MPEIQTKLGIEYRKVNGVLVKFYPQTTAEQVLFNSSTYTGQSTVKAALEDLNTRLSEVTALDALVFKGVVDGSHALPASGYEVGDVYRVAAAGTYAGQVCEIGDLITCVAVSSPASNDDWIVTQTNIDGAVVGPASAVNERIAVFDSTTGKLIKDGGMSIADIQDEIDSDVATHAAIAATGSALGHVTLSDATNSTSGAADGVAASPAAVKAAKDAADAAQADADALETRMDTAEDDIDALEGRMDTAEGDIDALEGRMDTAEGDIDALEGRMDTVEDTLEDLGAVVWAMYGAAGSAATADITNLADGGSYIEGLVDAAQSGD